MTQPSYLNRYGYLLLVIPPLIVIQLSLLLFERSIDPGIPLTDYLRQQASASPMLEPSQIFTEARARYTWFALALLDIIVPTIAAAVSITIILRSATRAQIHVMSLLGLLLAAGSCAYAFIGSNGLKQMVYGYTFDTLSASGRFSEAFLADVFRIIVVINVIAAIVPVIMLLGACSTLAPRPTQAGDPNDWAGRMRQLKEIINASSAYLVFGILHMGAWLQWPAALVSDEILSKVLTELARSITIYWGVSFTLIIITIYTPAAFFLHLRAKRLLIDQAIADPEKWLSAHELSITLGKQLPQLVIMLGPFFAGPLSSLLPGMHAFGSG
ncbi:MAG: hypothetical protein ACREVK_01325 [Gammaproteobacteria bacterium]